MNLTTTSASATESDSGRNDRDSQDRALTVVADYLRDCGVRHPDILRDQCHRFVDQAKDRFGLSTQTGDDHADPFRLSKLSLQIALEAISDQGLNQDRRSRQKAIPAIQTRSLPRNPTPTLVGPLRTEWWWTMILASVQRPAGWLTQPLRWVRPRPSVDEALSDGQS